ncbi:MAG: hypothetical protein EPO22_11990 [Dehalococcoidia bacterium]|nr:MAG: hypothetical protein EPO22_11990 [Dehalococcoidia bacterium]
MTRQSNTLMSATRQSKPGMAHVFSIFETSGGVLSGASYANAPIAELWDATDQLAPERGEKGGTLKPVIHTTMTTHPPSSSASSMT